VQCSLLKQRRHCVASTRLSHARARDVRSARVQWHRSRCRLGCSLALLWPCSRRVTPAATPAPLAQTLPASHLGGYDWSRSNTQNACCSGGKRRIVVRVSVSQLTKIAAQPRTGPQTSHPSLSKVRFARERPQSSPNSLVPLLQRIRSAPAPMTGDVQARSRQERRRESPPWKSRAHSSATSPRSCPGN